MNNGVVPAQVSLPADWPEAVSFVFGQADLVVSTVTLSSKVRPSCKPWLEHAAREVNQVWNYCNALTYKAWHNHFGGSRKWLSAYEIDKLTAGCGELFEKIGADVSQCVSAEHAAKRSQFKKSKLRWRKSGGAKRSLGWVPFKAPNLRFKVDKKDPSKIKVGFLGKSIRLFQAERLLGAYRLAKQGVGKLRAGNFSQDAVGDWYLNVVVDRVELQLAPVFGPDSSIGMDPGQQNAMTGSDSRTLRSGRYREMEPKIQQAQKNAHPGQAKRFNRKAKRQRLDDRNKFCRGVVGDYARVWVGDLSPKKMAKSKLKGQAKSVHDASFGAAYSTLEAMGHRAGRVVGKVNERNSTRSCSNCQALTGPAGLDGCVVRHWVCAACGTDHDRDVNSGENLRHAGETGWQNRLPGLEKRATPRYWRPFAGTR